MIMAGMHAVVAQPTSDMSGHNIAAPGRTNQNQNGSAV